MGEHKRHKGLGYQVTTVKIKAEVDDGVIVEVDDFDSEFGHWWVKLPECDWVKVATNFETLTREEAIRLAREFYRTEDNAG